MPSLTVSLISIYCECLSKQGRSCQCLHIMLTLFTCLAPASHCKNNTPDGMWTPYLPDSQDGFANKEQVEQAWPKPKIAAGRNVS